MTSSAQTEKRNEAPLLNLFCLQEDEAWRVHVRPAWVPSYLRPVFDENGEAYPVFLDFDDLDRHMAASQASFEKRVSAPTGAVELTARGEAATALAVWLSTAFASGVR